MLERHYSRGTPVKVSVEGSAVTRWTLLWLNCAPHNSHVETLTPKRWNVTLFEDRSFREVSKLK